MPKILNIRTLAALALTITLGTTATSGGSTTDPPVPGGFPGVVPAFMGGGDAVGDRRWLDRARPLGVEAPGWARRMYRRSLLVLRALTDPRTGSAVAGARTGWAYVWPRDAAAVAIAFAEAGYRSEAQRVARFLLGLDLEAAARFRGTGEPVPARETQGDAAGWVAAAARTAGVSPERSTEPISRESPATPAPPGGSTDTGSRVWRWRDSADYQEGDPGDYLGNAIATASLHATTEARPTAENPIRDGGAGAVQTEAAGLSGEFGSGHGLVRIAGDPGSGLDSVAAWAVQPFEIEALYPAARRTLRRLAAGSGRFGIAPSEDWEGGEDPWTAPTAWAAWGLAALAHDGRAPTGVRRQDRRAALRLMTTLRRASTPLGLLPERVDTHTGQPRSTTPLAWSHAFAILALRAIHRRQSRPR